MYIYKYMSTYICIHIYVFIYINTYIITMMTGGGMNYERSNLLANMVGWSILENKRLFQDLCS
jgi:hypothetical protein